MEWFIDEGVSGVNISRPVLDCILYGDVENPPIENVIVAKSDRVARYIKLYFYYKQLLYQKDIELVSVSEDFGEMGHSREYLKRLSCSLPNRRGPTLPVELRRDEF